MKCIYFFKLTQGLHALVWCRQIVSMEKSPYSANKVDAV